MNQAPRGYLYAFGASLALAASFIFSKSALNQINMYLFGFVWFGTGALLNFAWIIFRKGRNAFKVLPGGIFSLALAIALLEGVATVLFYVAIQKMENPAVVSFIGNLGPVLVTILGITILGEKYNAWQIGGIIMALLGVFLITYNKGSDIYSLIQPGSHYVLLASVLFAAATIVARKGKERLDTELMSTLRSFMLFIVFSGIVLGKGMKIQLNPGIWSDIVLGALLETLITIIFAYQALKYLEAAKTSLVISTKAIWLVVMAWIFLDTFPQGYELAGGLLSLAGIAIITWKKRQRSVRI
ncbi:MAG: DMT family transporter [Bacteroidales bacterium]|nr:DMT family transporter [Bacteroidales bacterium]